MKPTTRQVLVMLAIGAIVIFRLMPLFRDPEIRPGEVAILTDSTFYRVQRETPTLVTVYMRSGCATCKSVAESLQPLARAMRGRAIVSVCDIAENTRVAARERAVPGLVVIYRNGQEKSRSLGQDDAGFEADLRRITRSL